MATSAHTVRNVRRHARRTPKRAPKEPVAGTRLVIIKEFRNRDPGMFDPCFAPNMYGDHISYGKMVRTILHD